MIKIELAQKCAVAKSTIVNIKKKKNRKRVIKNYLEQLQTDFNKSKDFNGEK